MVLQNILIDFYKKLNEIDWTKNPSDNTWDIAKGQAGLSDPLFTQVPLNTQIIGFIQTIDSKLQNTTKKYICTEDTFQHSLPNPIMEKCRNFQFKWFQWIGGKYCAKVFDRT